MNPWAGALCGHSSLEESDKQKES